MSNNFKYLIFDFDGTLADTELIHLEAYKRIYRRFDLPKFTKVELVKIKSSKIKDLVKEYKIGPVKLLKIIQALNQETASLISQAKFYPGIKKILLQLKKDHILGILSSNQLSTIESFFNQQNLPMDSVFTFWRCEKEIFAKDRALTALMKKHKIPRQEVLYFGDQVRDIEACQRAGVAVATVTWGFANEELLASAQANFLLNHPSEILDLLS